MSGFLHPTARLAVAAIVLAIVGCGAHHVADLGATAAPLAQPPGGGAAPGTAHAAHDASARSTSGDAGAIAYWTCSMHPSVRQAGPGTCPICSMGLTPVTANEVQTGVIVVDAVRRQLLGVRTAAAERSDLTVHVHGYGLVGRDERRLIDVSLKVGGWITTLRADAVGAPVAKGQPLFELYSPDLLAAQQELIAVAAGGDALRAAARERLRLDDVGDAQIDAIAADGRARAVLPIASPINGYVVSKEVVQGSAVQQGMTVMRLGSLDTVWVVADVAPQDLPLLAVGQRATVTMPSTPPVAIVGSVGAIYPEVRDQTRAAQVRIELANADHALRPGGYAGVDVAVDLGERLIVPKDAVLVAGERRLVFVDLGDGRLRPQPVVVGHAGDDRVEVLDGLEAGDRVVTSGHFLISAESRLRSAEAFWGAAHE